MTDEGPYTTITVREYARLDAVVRHLRRRIQKARECLEKGQMAEALQIVKSESDTE